MPEPKKQQIALTYADYLTWEGDRRWELIDGVAYDMSPAPSLEHQQIVGNLYLQIRHALESSPCRVFFAPFDVRLPEPTGQADETISTVVQPDLAVICQAEKLDERGCLGAPDLVVEVLSPGTAYKDQTIKLQLYEKHGVKEYWLVNPVWQSIQAYCLDLDGRFSKPEEYRRGERLRARAVPAITLDLSMIFA